MADDDRPLVFLMDEYRHLICTPYSIENLHIMAKRLGITRHWFHRSKTGLHHYDVSKKRFEEILGHCTRTNPREIVLIIRESMGE